MSRGVNAARRQKLSLLWCRKWISLILQRSSYTSVTEPVALEHKLGQICNQSFRRRARSHHGTLFNNDMEPEGDIFLKNHPAKILHSQGRAYKGRGSLRESIFIKGWGLYKTISIVGLTNLVITKEATCTRTAPLLWKIQHLTNEISTKNWKSKSIYLATALEAPTIVPHGGPRWAQYMRQQRQSVSVYCWFQDGDLWQNSSLFSRRPHSSALNLQLFLDFPVFLFKIFPSKMWFTWNLWECGQPPVAWLLTRVSSRSKEKKVLFGPVINLPLKKETNLSSSCRVNYT